MNLILYDAPCPLCNRFIAFLIQRDPKKRFFFAPLQGKTSQSISNMPPILPAETIIFIEQYQTNKQSTYYKSKAVFRIFWSLGGPWKLIGWKYILPSCLFDWLYNLMAKKRYWISKKCSLVASKNLDKTRFLP